MVAIRKMVEIQRYSITRQYSKYLLLVVDMTLYYFIKKTISGSEETKLTVDWGE